MARGPEAYYKQSLSKKLPSTVFIQAVGGTFSNGIPDYYYEGNNKALWIEYKYLKSVPLTIDCKNLLSTLQYRWLERAKENNVACAVVVGSPKGGFVFSFGTWNVPITREAFLEGMESKQEIADWIERLTIKR